MTTSTQEWQAWLQAATHYAQAGATSAMVTLIHLEGSSYKGLGARMLVGPDGKTTGTISGGCLENDVALHALEVLKSGVPKRITYDSRSDEDLLWGLGLGCQGLIQLLIEPLLPKNALALVSALKTLFRKKETAIFANTWQVVENGDIRPQGLGLFAPKPLYFFPDNASLHSLLEGQVADFWQQRSTAPQVSAKCRVVSVPHDGADVNVLLQVIAPPPRLLVCGGGFDSPPLLELAHFLGWSTVLALPKPSPPDQVWPGEPTVVVGAFDLLKDHLEGNHPCLAVIKSHHYETDRHYLKTLIQSQKCCYIGLLGPKKRSLRMLDELREDGLVMDEVTLSKLFFPVGLDIGAETPQEIALAMFAEMRAFLAGRNGGPLKNRTGPIHRRGAKG